MQTVNACYCRRGMRPGKVLAFQRKAVGYVCALEGLSVLIFFFNHALFELNKGVWFNY